MKIVQSFWSKPFQQRFKGNPDVRPNGGWLNQSYYFMSWALSFWQLSRFYNQIELVTDRRGKEILVDVLRLPYAKVHITLDCLDSYSPDLWALGKIYAYGMQTEPFLHVDSDVFVWQRFDEEFLSSPLVAQHREFGYTFYQKLYTQLTATLPYIPQSVKDYAARHRQIDAYNLGVTGGHDVRFFNLFSRQALSFVDNNVPELAKVQMGLFNTVYEQVLFCSMAAAAEIPVSTLLHSDHESVTTWEAQGLDRFVIAPKNIGFIHLYGYCKRSERYCFVLEQKLKRAYPSQHRIISEVFNSAAISYETSDLDMS